MTTSDTPIPSSTPTEASEPNAGRCAVASGSAPVMSLFPFKLRVYDESQKAFPYSREIGPFWINIPVEEIGATIPPDFPGAHWEQVSRIEQYAKERIIADLECSFDVDAIVPAVPLATQKPEEPAPECYDIGAL